MRVYKVGITGHRPDRFKDQEKVKDLCLETVDKIQYQYSEQEALYFNVGGCIGADQWVGNACIKLEAAYNLYLPFPAEIQGRYWYDEQRKDLEKQIDECSSLTIVGPTYVVGNYFIRDKLIVDNSDFMVCFWEGCLQGGTYNTIKYAVQQSKIVLNALTGYSLVSKDQLFKRKINNKAE